MSISDKALRRKWSLRYLAAAALLLIFAGAYESFSHGVCSPRMVFAFLIPLILGLGPWLAYTALCRRIPHTWTRLWWNWALATLTAGSLLAGALEIYGTTNRLLRAYPPAGLTLGLLALGTELREYRRAVILPKSGR
ncbi:MAG: hypothetical protein IKQ69_09155 [Oscillospiraceae bacterium]|nr:hypothetical protein [Oscillospiraceae bacterium]